MIAPVRSRIRFGSLGAAMIAACGFSPPGQQAASGDAPMLIDAPFIAPDAGMCMTTSVTCADVNTLRICATVGGSAVDTPCPWGCSPNGAAPHCQMLQPTGSGAQAMDTVGSDVMTTTLPMGTMIHLDSGAIDPGIRSPGTGLNKGITFEVHNGIDVFRFGDLHVAGNVQFVSMQQPMPPIVLVSTGSIVVDGMIDATGTCNGGTAGPGGFPGGGGAGMGPGGGGASSDQTLGGGGAGYGAAGGAGGAGGSAPAIAGGSAYGTNTIDILVGGASGGGGNGGNPFGGAGGGAIQLVANNAITINNAGAATPNPTGINAGGCGGTSGHAGGSTNNDTGGGGGAGGAILLEAHDITINGALAVNGGGGGGTHVNNGSATDGQKGQLGRTAAAGGMGGDAVGGVGGAGGAIAGAQGGTGNGVGAGGGGAVGRMRFNTRSGAATVNASAVLSPSLQDSPTTCTQGSAQTTD